jgi:hypothetical protein
MGPARNASRCSYQAHWSPSHGGTCPVDDVAAVTADVTAEAGDSLALGVVYTATWFDAARVIEGLFRDESETAMR